MEEKEGLLEEVDGWLGEANVNKRPGEGQIIARLTLSINDLAVLEARDGPNESLDKVLGLLRVRTTLLVALEKNVLDERSKALISGLEKNLACLVEETNREVDHLGETAALLANDDALHGLMLALRHEREATHERGDLGFSNGGEGLSS